MESIIKGNLEDNKDSKRGWFIGHFREEGSVFKSNDFEFKWNFFPKGKVRKIPAIQKTAKTVCVLIEGKFLFSFPDEEKDVILSKRGDYVFWDANVVHTTEALNDSVILTLRWPSIKGDQKSI